MKDKDIPWNEVTPMEKWVEKMLREGSTESIESVRRLMNGLPESSKAKYREIWKRVVGDKSRE